MSTHVHMYVYTHTYTDNLYAQLSNGCYPFYLLFLLLTNDEVVIRISVGTEGPGIVITLTQCLLLTPSCNGPTPKPK